MGWDEDICQGNHFPQHPRAQRSKAMLLTRPLQSPHELRMVRKRGQPLQLSTIPGHPGISVRQRRKEKSGQFSIVEIGVEEEFRCDDSPAVATKKQNFFA